MNRSAHTEIHQDLRRLRMMIDALPTPTLIEDEQRALVCVNQAFCNMFRITASPDDLIGANCAQAAEHAKTLFLEPEAFIDGIQRTLAARQPVQGEVIALKDGHVLERRYTPLIIDGVYQGHFWQYEDITERHVIARELEASRDRAWEASRLKSEFLAMMSHEIRTPMNGVIGMAELLLSTNLDETQRDYATMIYEESNALLRILNDILDFSRIEAGKVVLDPVPYSAYELCAHIAEVARRQAERKGLAFHVVLPPGIPVLYGDGGRLRQIVINLITNAIKFTKKGSVSLIVEAEPAGDQQVMLRIHVRDTGVGIAAEKIPSLFEPFVQADSSTTRQHGGTGLGLAIVKRLVTLLNGTIDVVSEPGQGSTFTVTAMMDRASDSSAAFATSSKEVQQSAPPPKPADSSKRILIVEDNAANRQLTLDYLHMLGYHNLQFAEDGEEAVEMVQAAEEYPFALVLMDIQLVRMDGLTATRIIRASEAESSRHTPIVALTAHAMAEDRRACLAAGMDDVLVKPVQRASLLKVLTTYVSGA